MINVLVWSVRYFRSILANDHCFRGNRVANQSPTCGLLIAGVVCKVWSIETNSNASCCSVTIAIRPSSEGERPSFAYAIPWLPATCRMQWPAASPSVRGRRSEAWPFPPVPPGGFSSQTFRISCRAERAPCSSPVPAAAGGAWTWTWVSLDHRPNDVSFLGGIDLRAFSASTARCSRSTTGSTAVPSTPDGRREHAHRTLLNGVVVDADQGEITNIGAPVVGGTEGTSSPERRVSTPCDSSAADIR